MKSNTWSSYFYNISFKKRLFIRIRVILMPNTVFLHSYIIEMYCLRKTVILLTAWICNMGHVNAVANTMQKLTLNRK